MLLFSASCPSPCFDLPVQAAPFARHTSYDYLTSSSCLLHCVKLVAFRSPQPQLSPNFTATSIIYFFSSFLTLSHFRRLLQSFLFLQSFKMLLPRQTNAPTNNNNNDGIVLEDDSRFDNFWFTRVRNSPSWRNVHLLILKRLALLSNSPFSASSSSSFSSGSSGAITTPNAV